MLIFIVRVRAYAGVRMIEIVGVGVWVCAACVFVCAGCVCVSVRRYVCVNARAHARVCVCEYVCVRALVCV